MNLIKSTILLISITLVSTHSFSQIPAGTIMASGYYAIVSTNSDKALAETYIDGIKTFYYSKDGPPSVDGSPFLDRDFFPGEIGFNDSIKLTDISLRYNIYMDQMQVIFDQDTLVVQPSYLIDFIRIDERFFIFSLIYDKSTRKFSKGYFELLSDGDYKLLLRRKRPLLFDSYATNYNSGGGTKRYYFGDESAFYIKKGEEAATKVGRSSKQVLKVFPPEKQDVIKKFIEENDIKVRNEEGMVRVMEFVNKMKDEE